MAEFAEVMRQWVRARKTTASNTEENVLSVYPLDEYDDALIANIEKNVMKWAAEHPKSVYPTWWEYLTRIHAIFPAMGDFQKCVDDLATTPIPADIAQKLGIEPKED